MKPGLIESAGQGGSAFDPPRSGAKGKKLTALEDWDSGVAAVRDELLEKVLAYNCCRIILMKKRRRETLDQAA